MNNGIRSYSANDDFNSDPTSTVLSGMSYFIEEEKGNDAHRRNVEQNIEFLRSKQDVKVTDLVDEDADALDSVIESLRILKGSDSEFKELEKKVQSMFTTNEPGTVGSLFLRCFKNTKGIAGCASDCANEAELSKKGTCSNLVLVYEDGRLKKLNDIKSKHAVVYVKDPRFVIHDKFKDDIKKAKVESITLVTYKNDEMKEEKYYKTEDLVGNSSNGAWIGIILVIIVVVIIAIIGLLYYQNPKLLDVNKFNQFTF